METIKHKVEYHDNPCRACITGEGHYTVSCNTCEDRKARAQGIVAEIAENLIVERG